MSATTSASTQRKYGVRRVCAAWEIPRSTVYARQARSTDPTPRMRRGPAPAVSDAELLALVRADLARSPFTGEGHRKVHARLRALDGVSVRRERVLRVMREHGLLSPHRSARRPGPAHTGRIVTDGPNRMWGTDAAMVTTVEDGVVWAFVAVEHWNAECVGWHVSMDGSRYAALEPVAMGLRDVYGSVAAETARGMSLRMDHGPQYTSDHFHRQVRFWGIEPSHALVREPETNGVSERFIRTLKEQAIHGHVFRNVAEVRAAVGDFVERYNAEWLVEKNGFVSPRRARELHALRQVA